MKITDAKIGPLPTHLFDPKPEVKVWYEDGTNEVLFDFYFDEISFTKEEFIGLTKEQGISLRHKKDVAFLKN